MMLKRTNTNETTDIVCILDESPSMSHLTDSTISSFNEFIDGQIDVPGTCKVSLFTFTHKLKERFVNKSLKGSKINRESYRPQGRGTALNDAIGNVLVNFSSSADKTIVMIFTDGEENSSKEFSTIAIKKLIQQKIRNYDWAFIYLGANQDSFAVSQTYGINQNFVSNFNANEFGNTSAYLTAGATVADLRGTMGTSHYGSTITEDATAIEEDLRSKTTCTKTKTGV